MRNLLAVLFFAASTASAADLPKYWTVHIDYASDRAAYEAIDKQFSSAQRDFYAAHNVAHLFLSNEPLKIRTLGKLAKTTDQTAMPRPDLSSTDPAKWLQW